MNSLPDRKTFMAARFVEQFGRTPDYWARAPGRVDLMGSHTDYNMGYVLTTTLDRDTWLAASARSDGRISIRSLNTDGGADFSLDSIVRDSAYPWTNYVRGVLKVLHDAGFMLRGFDGLIHSTIPLNSGLSSSAAIEMATSLIAQTVSGFALDPLQMALYGQKAENRFVGVNSGILDQYSSAMGREGCSLLLDCRALTSQIVPIASGLQIVICDTRAPRNLIGTEYDDRRAQCEDGVRRLQVYYPAVQALRDVSLPQFTAHEKDLPEGVARRCRFIIEENQRVLALAEALPTGDRETINSLLRDSYQGARDLYEIGAPAMASMMQAMCAAPGVVGARQAGAGFGGCMVAVAEIEQVNAFQEYVVRTYSNNTGITPYVYPIKASDGAAILE
jgi:galactokinase